MRQDGRHFPDDSFKCIFLNENVLILIKISLKFAPKGPINDIPSLFQIMAWSRPGGKPLSEPMMVWSTDAYMHHWGFNELYKDKIVHGPPIFIYGNSSDMRENIPCFPTVPSRHSHSPPPPASHPQHKHCPSQITLHQTNISLWYLSQTISHYLSYTSIIYTSFSTLFGWIPLLIVVEQQHTFIFWEGCYVEKN